MTHLRRWRIAALVGIVVLAAAMLTAGILILTGAAPGLAPAGVQVRFLSADPTAGVEVRLDEVNNGFLLGVTPFSTTIPSTGKYTYLALAEDYHPGRGTITVTETTVIPPLRRVGGEIRVRTSAEALISLDGREMGRVEAGWTSLGFYPPGDYVVTAETDVGKQSKKAYVGPAADGKVEFLWGSRLVVVVSPTDVPSLTVTVAGRPYRGPMNFSYDDTRKKTVQVRVQAPGYFPWAEKAPLRSGKVTVITATLAVDPRPGEVLAAYRRYWEVWTEAQRTLEILHLPEVMTGTLLANWQAGLETVRALGLGGTAVEPSVHTPTITVLSDITATVRAVLDVREKPVSGVARTSHLDGIFTFVKGADGVWRAASWESLVPREAALVPTPGTGKGGGGGGGGGSVPRPAPADRRLVASIILAAINCARQEKGWPPVVWDQELADAIQPIVEEEGAYYRDHPFNLEHYRAAFEPRENAILHPLGAIGLDGGGLPLSLVPSRQRAGTFAYDWENYADRPCETHRGDFMANEEWTRPITRVAVVISAPWWDGVWWKAWYLVVGRP